MQKLKSIKLTGATTILKCALIGIVSTLIGTLIFAFVLKFANLSSKFIGYINNIIKVFSMFLMIMCLKHKDSTKLMFKSIFAGAFYFVLCFIIFSILNGDFSVGTSFLYDLLFSIITSVVSSVIVNLLGHKTT